MIIRLIIKEIVYKKFNFLLALLGVSFAVAFFVFFFTANEASTRETIRLTRDMGYNLRIIPKDTDMNIFWTTGYSEYTMPEDYVDRFLQFKDFSFARSGKRCIMNISEKGVSASRESTFDRQGI